MKTYRANKLITLPLLFAAVFFGSAGQAVSQISPQRIKVPRASAKPAATPSDDSSKSLSRLRTRIAIALANPLLRRGRIGLKIESLDTGNVVYERFADSYFVPASNMKSFTVAAAFERLGPGYRFATSVYAASPPDVEGKISGDLIIYGRGDPSISASFNDGDQYAALDELADRIIKAGVKRIEGGIVGDESYFNTKPIPFGWEWDDLQWYYGAEISALSINDNRIELKIAPGKPGTSCTVTVTPGSRLIRVINLARTVPRGGKKTLKITKRLGQNTIEVSGDLPAGGGGFTGYIAVSRPAALFAELLKQRLEQKGIVVKRAARAVNGGQRGGERLNPPELVEIARLLSPPLSIIAGKIMKPSQNLYTELLLRTMGETLGNGDDRDKTSEQKGIEVIGSVLEKAGVDSESIVQYDASGLSRHNLITPDSVVKLFRYMNDGPNSAAWKNSLTIGGVDGTLQKRFRGTAVSGNVRGKTGTLDQVSALSGYVTSKSGERFVFSILANNIPQVSLRISTIDLIVTHLANFAGRTDARAVPVQTKVN